MKCNNFGFLLSFIFFEFTTYLSIDMYLSALPSIAKDFEVSNSLVQYTLPFSFFGAFLSALVLGPISDRFNHDRVLLFSALLFTLSSLICAISNNIWSLLLAKFVQGSVAPSILIGYVIIHEIYDSRPAVQIISFIASIVVWSSLIGPLLGSFILQLGHWQMIFWVLFVISILSTICLKIYVPKIIYEKVPFNLKNIFINYQNCLCNLNFMKFLIIYAMIMTIFIIWITKSPFIIIDTLEKSPMLFGLIQIIIFTSFVIGAQIIRYLIVKKNLFHIIRTGMSITAVGITFFCITSYFHQTIGAVISMAVFALGAAILLGPFNRLAIEASSKTMGITVAIFTAFVNLFGVVGGLSVTLFCTDTFESIAILIGIWFLIIYIIYLTLPKIMFKFDRI